MLSGALFSEAEEEPGALSLVPAASEPEGEDDSEDPLPPAEPLDDPLELDA